MSLRRWALQASWRRPSSSLLRCSLCVGSMSQSSAVPPDAPVAAPTPRKSIAPFTSGQSFSSSSASTSTATASSSKASASSSSSSAPADRVCLDQVAQSVHLLSVDGFEWIDFTADPAMRKSILYDGGFVAATRRFLRRHQISDDVITKVATDVWLPLTLVSGDGDSICVVTRVVATMDDEQMASLWLMDDSVSMAQKSGIRQGGALGGAATYPQSVAAAFNESPHASTSQGESAKEGSSSSVAGGGGTILELTGRLNIFINKRTRKIISVHRGPLPFVMELQRNWPVKHRLETMQTLFYRLMRGSVASFQDSQGDTANRLDALESLLFHDDSKSSPGVLFPWISSTSIRGVARLYSKTNASGAHHQNNPRKAAAIATASEHAFIMSHLQSINRKASAHVRVLREVDRAYRQAVAAMAVLPKQASPAVNGVMASDAANTAAAAAKVSSEETVGGEGEEQKRRSSGVGSNVRELSHQIQSVLFQWEGIKEQSQSLLSLQVSVAVSRLEEFLRLLTVYSTIFIPLEFITAIFGMNFVSLIELGEDDSAVWICVALMLVTAIATQRWINKTSTSLFSVAT